MPTDESLENLITETIEKLELAISELFKISKDDDMQINLIVFNNCGYQQSPSAGDPRFHAPAWERAIPCKERVPTQEHGNRADNFAFVDNRIINYCFKRLRKYAQTSY